MTLLIARTTHHIWSPPTFPMWMISFLAVLTCWVLLLLIIFILITFLLIFPAFLLCFELDYDLARKTPSAVFDSSLNNSFLNNLLCSWICREFINSISEIIVRSLESSNDEIFASNLFGRLTNPFSTILLSGKSSRNSQIMLTTAKSLSKYSLMVLAYFILNISNSLLRLRTCIYRVLSFSWNASWRVFQAFLAVSQDIILVNTTSETTEWIQVLAFAVLITSLL